MARKGPVVKVTLTGDEKDAVRAVKNAEGALGHFGKSLPAGVSGPLGKITGELGKNLPLAAAAGAAAIVGFVGKSIGEFQKQALAVKSFSEITALSSIEASKFVAVADDYAVGADELSAAIGKMNKAAGLTPEKFKAAGIAIARSKDGAYDAEQQFFNVVDAFNSTTDASKRAEIGSLAFGKGWQTLVKLLDTGTGQLRKDFAEVQKFQLFDDASLKKAEDNRRAIDDLSDAWKGFERTVGERAIPAATRLAKLGTEWTEKLFNTADRVARFRERVGEGFGHIGNAAEKAGHFVTDFFDSGDGFNPFAERFNTAGATDVKIAEEVARVTKIATEAIAAGDKVRKEAADNTAKYASNRGYAEMLNEQGKAAMKAREALDKYRTSARELAHDQLGLEGAINNATDAFSAYDELAHDSKSTLRDYRDANLAAREAMLSVADAALTTAQKEAELNGTTLSTKQAADVQIGALRDLEKSLKPDSPLRKYLEQYIADLLKIPGDVTTSVSIEDKHGNVAQKRYGGRYAAGGVVHAVPGGTMILAGEAGVDEAVIPLDGRHRLGGTTTVIQNFPAGVDPRRVNEATRRHQWRNGAA